MPCESACISTNRKIARKSTKLWTPMNEDWLRTVTMGSTELCWIWCSASANQFFSSFKNISVSVNFLFSLSTFRLNPFLCSKLLWQGDEVEIPHFMKSISSHSGISALYAVKWKWNRIFFSSDNLDMSSWIALPLKGSGLKLILLWSVCSFSAFEKAALCSFSASIAPLVSRACYLSFDILTEGMHRLSSQQ